MEPCGTPALAGNYSEVWPFNRTLWNLLLKKLLMRLNRESETPIDLSLNTNPWCQTLSKALEISKNIPQIACIRSQSNEELISWAIDNNCEMQESPGKKPEWPLVNNSFLWK